SPRSYRGLHPLFSIDVQRIAAKDGRHSSHHQDPCSPPTPQVPEIPKALGASPLPSESRSPCRFEDPSLDQPSLLVGRGRSSHLNTAADAETHASIRASTYPQQSGYRPIEQSRR